jgi:hypothetical protein
LPIAQVGPNYRYVDAICIIAQTVCWKLSFTPTLVIKFQ